MSVGLGLRGGEEKVGGVRVGVLGFRREVLGLREGIAARGKEVGTLLAERKRIRKDVVLGRRLLDVEERAAELEVRLGLAEGDVYEEEGEARAETTAGLYAQLLAVLEAVGEHPFVEKQRERLKAIREALISDLGVALRAARADKDDTTALLSVIASYRDIGEAAEAVKALKIG